MTCRLHPSSFLLHPLRDCHFARRTIQNIKVSQVLPTKIGRQARNDAPPSSFILSPSSLKRLPRRTKDFSKYQSFSSAPRNDAFSFIFPTSSLYLLPQSKIYPLNSTLLPSSLILSPSSFLPFPHSTLLILSTISYISGSVILNDS